ncbi:MAG: WD40 repeat domain-containing protein, partial [Calditrichaeota bacterium]|nr:WD40 repeat domain-containing protein [Calditrichota bacterium]
DFDGKIRVWQLPSGKLLRQFAAHPSAIAAIRIAPNAGYFISSGFDFKVKFWWLEDKDTFLKQFRG